MMSLFPVTGGEKEEGRKNGSKITPAHVDKKGNRCLGWGINDKAIYDRGGRELGWREKTGRF